MLTAARLSMLFLLLAACGDSGGEVVGASSGDAGSQLAAAADDAIEFGSVPPFELTDQDGELVSLETLRGQPFALAAIFTTCTGPCPTLTTHMRELQDELAGTDVRLVSVSVDAEIDTPEVLAAYAKSYGADLERWSFLTGAEETTHALLRDGFWMGVERASEDEFVFGLQVTHSALIVAVDRNGIRRGWYDGTSVAALESLRDRLLFLADEER